MNRNGLTVYRVVWLLCAPVISFAQNPFTSPPPEIPQDNLTTITELSSVKSACESLGYTSESSLKLCTKDLLLAASECTEETSDQIPQASYGQITDAQKAAYREAHTQCVLNKATGAT